MKLEDAYFPADYFAARSAFRERAADADQHTHIIAAPGPNGETLSIDSAYLGDPAPRQLVIITSGVHGVEGYAGSALQQLWLTEFDKQLPDATGVLLVHALNPYGFAHNRRVNEHNVDLNRNALAAFPGPSNAGYRSLDTWLNPPSPAPRLDDFFWRALPHLRHAPRALVQAIAFGQYEFPHGLFYGGREHEPSIILFNQMLSAQRYKSVQRVWHLDLHTGLGRYGRCEWLLDEAPGEHEYSMLTRSVDTRATQMNPAVRITDQNAHGIMTTLVRRAFPQATTLAATLEFGTLGPVTLLRILRAENRAHHYGTRRTADTTRLRAALCDANAPRDPAWRARVIVGGRRIFTQLQGMLE